MNNQPLKQQETFKSKMGFILSASGAAVGLGNIWSFPTQVADHGGAAFILVYLFMIIAIGFPIMVIELTLGKHGRSDPIASMRKAAAHPLLKCLAIPLTLIGILVPTLVILFYNIVSGWILMHLLGYLISLVDPKAAEWFFTFSVERNLLGSLIMFILTIGIISQGVNKGIERWSSKMMPALFVLFVVLFCFILTQEGAFEGLKHFFVPNIDQVLESNVWIKAMSQAFFSLTIGSCVLLTYGSYLNNSVNIPKTASQIILIDTGIALLAGLVVIPAMFVALHQGIVIYSSSGNLISSTGLLFEVLPALFDNLGTQGYLVGITFFALMCIATLTSSISMLEIPVVAIKNYVPCSKQQLTWILGILLFLGSALTCLYFDKLFALLISLSTEHLMPFFALVVAIWGSWVLSRTHLLENLCQTSTHPTWKIRTLIIYLKYICPVIVGIIFLNALKII